MANPLIKAPDGRIVVAPRGLTVTVILDGCPVTSINEAVLKPGWTIATPADLAALAKKNKDK